MKKANTTVRITTTATTIKTVRSTTIEINTSRNAVRHANNKNSGTKAAPTPAKPAALICPSASETCTGAVIGGAVGAAIGTEICPVIGTAAGAVIGGLATAFGVSRLLD